MTYLSIRSLQTLAGAAALVAGLAVAAPLVRAADLYDDPPPINRGSAYDDPRYADLYGHTPPPPPPRDVYRDDYRPSPRRAEGCASKDEISRSLEHDGWGEFVNPQVIDRGTASIDARRPSGRPFRLVVDRCTGEILAAQPLDQPQYRTFADRYDRYDRYHDDYGRRPLRPF